MADDDYERIVLVKPEVFMYRIPPRTTNRAYRAADWKLDAPDWTGRLRIVSKGSNCVLKLEDKITGELFAACPVDGYPGTSIESVSDSARYFVIRIKDDIGRATNIGIGFIDRSDSFDFNVALQDFFKYLKQSKEAANQPIVDDGKKLDLKFKEGQTITINIGKKTESTTVQKPKATGNLSGGLGLLPPPPSSRSNPNNQVKINPASFSTTQNQTQSKAQSSNALNDDLLLLDIGGASGGPATSFQSTKTSQQSNFGQNLLDF